jgi:flagellar hook-basal body complex protein FliE
MSVNAISSAAGPLIAPGAASSTQSASAGSAPFGNLVEKFLGNVNQNREQTANSVRDLAMGKTDNLHEIMLQAAQSDLSFRLVLEIRNRLTDAYQEIMKMQV